MKEEELDFLRRWEQDVAFWWVALGHMVSVAMIYIGWAEGEIPLAFWVAGLLLNGLFPLLTRRDTWLRNLSVWAVTLMVGVGYGLTVKGEGLGILLTFGGAFLAMSLLTHHLLKGIGEDEEESGAKYIFAYAIALVTLWAAFILDQYLWTVILLFVSATAFRIYRGMVFEYRMRKGLIRQALQMRARRREIRRRIKETNGEG